MSAPLPLRSFTEFQPGPLTERDLATCANCGCAFSAIQQPAAYRCGLPRLVCPICDHAAGVIIERAQHGREL
jgi:hypothetical protein